MGTHETHIEKYEQEPSAEETLKSAIDDAWGKYERYRTPQTEESHSTLTLYTPPDERGRYSKLTFGPLGYQGRDGYEGAGNESLIEHKSSGFRGQKREVVVKKFKDGKVSAYEPNVLVKAEGPVDNEFFGASSSDDLRFARVDHDYFAELTDLLDQATPEKPKISVSHTLGRVAARLTRRK